MSVVIRLMRAGAKKRPFYRMVAADSRRQRDGRFLEILGHYNPVAQPYELMVHKDKVEKWLSRGAQPSEQAASLLRLLLFGQRRPAPPAAVGQDTAKPKKVTAKAATKRRVARKVSERKTRKKAVKRASKKTTKV
jgi:small subunit ribosomal protein S16